MNESMREQFESAVIARMKESGFLEVEIRVECLSRHGDDYHDSSINAYWEFWKIAFRIATEQYEKLKSLESDVCVAFNPVLQPEYICEGCGSNGWTGNCDKCIPY